MPDWTSSPAQTTPAHLQYWSGPLTFNLSTLANQIDDAMDGADLIGGKQAYKINDVLQAVEDACRARGLTILGDAALAVRTATAASQFAEGLEPMQLRPFC